MPCACAMASQAAVSTASPAHQRAISGTRGQPATPRRSSHAPPAIHSAPTPSHKAGRGRATAPPSHSPAQSAAHSSPVARAGAPARPLSRAHSQAAAAISASVSARKGAATGAKRAGRKTASSTKAVMTRCFSMPARPVAALAAALARRFCQSAARARRRRPGPRPARLRQSPARAGR